MDFLFSQEREPEVLQIERCIMEHPVTRISEGLRKILIILCLKHSPVLAVRFQHIPSTKVDMKRFEEINSLLGESGTYYLIAVDMNANYSYLNKRYADIFKPIHGDLVGKHYAVTMHPDDQQTFKIVSQMAFRYPNSVFPATLRKHDGLGGFIVTRCEYEAMFEDDGSPSGIFCIGHDITELLKITGKLHAWLHMKNRS